MEILPLLSIFVVGLSYGATACMLSCMPFLSPIILANSKKSDAMLVVIPFSMGRIFTYVAISVVAFLSSAMIKNLIEEKSSISQIFGLIIIFLSIFMFYRAFQNSSCCTKSSAKFLGSKISFFGMGALISLNPCLPVLSLVSLSSSVDSLFFALFLGLFFALGATLVQFLFFGFLFSHIANEITKELVTHKRKIEIFASMILMVTGFLVLGGFITT